jgi:CheY-like chemotaxis protein
MAEKKIFSRLNRWWHSEAQPAPGEPMPDAGQETGEAAAEQSPGGEPDSGRPSLLDSYAQDILPPEVEAAGAAALEAEIENLTRKLEKKQQHLESLLQQRNELHHQLRAAQDTIAGLEAQLNARQAENETAAAAQLESDQELSRQLHAERDAALNLVQELESKLRENQVAHENALRERDARLAALEAELTSRAQSVEVIAREKEELNRHLAALEQDLERARAAQLELAQARQEAERALAMASEAADATQRAEQRAAALQAELAAVQAELIQSLAEQEKLREQAAAPAAPPVAAPTPIESVDLTPELMEVAAAAPAPPAEPPEAPAPVASVPEPTSEPVSFEVVAVPEEPVAEPVAPPEPVPEPPVRAKKLVLIAEDDPGIRRLIELTLQKAGLDVLTAEDGEDAFQKAVTERPDAVLTDMMMPRMNGLELTSRLKKTPATARIPIGFLTAQRELDYYKGALDLGSTLYVTKPFRPDNLVTLVNLLLTGKKKPRPGHK